MKDDTTSNDTTVTASVPIYSNGTVPFYSNGTVWKSTYPSNPVNNYYNTNVGSQNTKVVIQNAYVNIDGVELSLPEVLGTIMQRLAILAPSIELHSKYPALKEAYEAYKIIEAMCKSEEEKESK